MRAKGALFTVLLGLSGCFSGDDFSECTDDDQCGMAGVCEGNKCVPGLDDLGPLPMDARVPDAAAPIEITGEISNSSQNFVGEEIIIGPIELVGIQYVRFNARKITIRGELDLDGAGHPGGGGGGGGGGASTMNALSSGGEGGEAVGLATVGLAGQNNSGETLGLGGRGGNGGGLGSGDGGNGGEPGNDGLLLVADCNLGAQPLIGSGGGGGGGGRGGAAGACRGGGGGGGGSGGAGGPALIFEATEIIILDGTISAKGVQGIKSNPAINGAPGCAACDENCGEIAGRGGRGGASGFGESEGFGTAEGDAHEGSPGGAGSGGSVILKAPKIRASVGSKIEVGSGDPAGIDKKKGLVAIYGQIIQAPALIGVQLSCRD